MKVSDIKAKALKLMNDYSTNGTLVSNSENADYINRMYDYILDAEKEISIKKEILKQADIMTSEEMGRYTQCIYPKNCKEIKYILKSLSEYRNFKTDLKFYYVLNELADGEIVYSKEPDIINSDSQSIETEWEPIPFYVAGMLFIDELPDISKILLGLYSSKVNMIRKDRLQTTVNNIYGGICRLD